MCRLMRRMMRWLTRRLRTRESKRARAHRCGPLQRDARREGFRARRPGGRVLVHICDRRLLLSWAYWCMHVACNRSLLGTT
eukprot:1811963-Prymnesium_polylepis.1